MEKKMRYRDLLTQKNYLKLIAANVINRFGDSVDSIALTWLVYAISGNAIWSAVIYGVNQLPGILLGPFMGVLVEQWRKKYLMLITDILRGIFVVGFAVLYVMELLNPWIMLLFTLAISTVETFRIPAGIAFVPKILDRDFYEFGMGLNAALSTVMQVVGAAAGGVIIGIFGIQAAIFTDAVTYFLSGGIIMMIEYQEEKIAKIGKKRTISGIWKSCQSYTDNLKEGFLYVRTKKIVINFCILAFLLNGLLVPFNAFAAPMVDMLKMGTEFLSLINVALLLGMSMASFVYPYIRQKCNATKLVIFSGVVMGIAYLCYPVGILFRENTVAITGICITAGFGIGCVVGFISAVMSAEFAKAVEQKYLARCSSVFNSAACAAAPVISALCSIVVAFLPVFVIFIACGGLSVILFICMAIRRMEFEASEEA